MDLNLMRSERRGSTGTDGAEDPGASSNHELCRVQEVSITS